MTQLDGNYWQDRWADANTPWDMGHASPALVEYAAQLPRRDLRILIPGAGSGHEAVWLRSEGFTEVTILDIAEGALEQLQDKAPDFPKEHLVHGDFFSHEGEYDVILEQTFFCALSPDLRPAYVTQMHRLLADGGTLAGLLFDFEKEDGPPFGGSEEEYRSRFEPLFEVRTMERAYNSIPPRQGSELFFILKKKN